MQYNIEPMWFYLISVAERTRTAVLIVFCFILFAALFIVPFLASNDDFTFSTVKKIYVFLSVAAFVCLVIMVLVPPREVLIEMLIAKHATYENADLVIKSIETFTNYVIEKLQN